MLIACVMSKDSQLSYNKFHSMTGTVTAGYKKMTIV